MSKIENFGDKINSNGLDKNKDNINLDGRPKKGIGLVNNELKEKGYTPATKQDIELNYMSLLQLSQPELVELGKDESKPMLIRIIVKNMLGGKGFDIIEKMLDRGIGKAVQKEERRQVDEDGKDVIPNIIINGTNNSAKIIE